MISFTTYNKKSRKTDIAYTIAIVVGIITAIAFLVCIQMNIDIPKWSYLLLIVSFVPFGILEILICYRDFLAPIKDTSKLIFFNDYLVFDNKKLTYSRIEKLSIRIKVAVREKHRIGNNHFELKTIEGKRLKLGLILKDEQDLSKIHQLVLFLQKNVSNLKINN